MPAFRYTAMDHEGKEVEGTVEAATEAEATDRVRANGYFPTSVRRGSGGRDESWKCPRCGFALVGAVERCDQCGAWVSRPEVSVSTVAAPVESARESSQLTDLEARLLELMREGKKIQAIKIHREATGAGLKESKDYVEALARSHNVPDRGAGCATTSAALILLAIAVGVLVNS